MEFPGSRHRRQARPEVDRHGEFARFQIITEHPASRIFAEDAGLGFERTDEANTTFNARIHETLADVGAVSEDVFIGCVENGPQDWSFGFGRAQYVTGELHVPELA